METDFLVIGSGIAGLTFTLKALPYGNVSIITKKESTEANTNYAQGGIAAVFSARDSLELHIRDTLQTGGGLSKEEPVRIMVEEGPGLVTELSKLGTEFNNKDGKFELGMEAGHSERRIVHAKDATGKEVENTLVETVKARGADLFENYLAIDLILKDSYCIGAWCLDVEKENIFPFFSKTTLIASGGVGEIYLHTTNPSIATGDGIAMAYRAGARIANLEFVQFHPTSFYGKKIGSRTLLLSEAIRGEGGLLKTQDGQTFMKKYDPRAELAPRDIVARAIDNELKERGEDYVLLDVTHLSANLIKDKFPNVYEVCLSLGVDPLKEAIPVVPTAHYECGGILTDINGQTDINGLYAAGETTYVGVHGANRLASNSLLESIVFAKRAALSAVKTLKNIQYPALDYAVETKRAQPLQENIISDYRLKLKKIMWNCVGIVRSNKKLKEAKTKVLQYKKKIEKLYNTHFPTLPLVELRNMLTCASLIIECALWRKESRGLHFNIDYPKRDDLHYKKDTIIKIKEDL
ncbi:L-aspartate oxidase [candidate division WOR-3 bacterium]|nr:L-aspartate oxidase [candidate division WOR-3 bacterium]